MKLTKYGFRQDLFGFSSVLSVLGIFVSLSGIIGGIWFTVRGAQYGCPVKWVSGYGYQSHCIAMGVFCVIGSAFIILMLPYLVLWINLKKKTSKKDIPGIERIGKVYGYVSGSMEIIVVIVRILLSILIIAFIYGLIDLTWVEYILWSIRNAPSFDLRVLPITVIIHSAISLNFICLKIHGTRVKNNKLLGTYLGFRYSLFILHMIALIIASVSAPGVLDGDNVLVLAFGFAALVIDIVYLILDIGLTVILHSIRVDRENTAGTGNPIENI